MRLLVHLGSLSFSYVLLLYTFRLIKSLKVLEMH